MSKSPVAEHHASTGSGKKKRGVGRRRSRKKKGKRKKEEKPPLQTRRSLGRKNKIARAAENQRDTVCVRACVCRKKETEGESMIRSQVFGLFKGATGIRESLRMAVKWARSVV